MKVHRKDIMFAYLENLEHHPGKATVMYSEHKETIDFFWKWWDRNRDIFSQRMKRLQYKSFALSQQKG